MVIRKPLIFIGILVASIPVAFYLQSLFYIATPLALFFYCYSKDKDDNHKIVIAKALILAYVIAFLVYGVSYMVIVSIFI